MNYTEKVIKTYDISSEYQLNKIIEQLEKSKTYHPLV